MTRPFEGIRIIDATHVLAGPFAAYQLGLLGADVIKIEHPKDPDQSRVSGGDWELNRAGMGSYYLTQGSNKRSMTLDLKQDAAREIFRKLIAGADVLVENFRPGVLARLGLDWERLHALNPRLIYCSITGFGQTGPYSDRAGYDYAVQGIGGLMSVTGERDDLGGGPQKVGVAVADLFTGMYATVGILAALRHAEKTGQGQYVDMALLDTQVAMLANLGANFLVSGKTPGRAGNAHQNIVPYQVFEVKPGPELLASNGPAARDHLILAVGNDGQYAKFCEVAGHPELAADVRFAKNTDRVKNRQVLVPLLETIMLTRSKADWLSALEAAKVPCGAINNLSEVFADPQVEAREMVSTWQHPHQKDLKLVSSPLKLSVTPVRKDHVPPQLGQHTEVLLKEVLGYTDAQIEALRHQDIIG